MPNFNNTSEIKLFLSDFSSGMLDTVQANTSESRFVGYQVIDAQKIPPDRFWDQYDLPIYI